jgi:hypothetical protein
MVALRPQQRMKEKGGKKSLLSTSQGLDGLTAYNASTMHRRNIEKASKVKAMRKLRKSLIDQNEMVDEIVGYMRKRPQSYWTIVSGQTRRDNTTKAQLLFFAKLLFDDATAKGVQDGSPWVGELCERIEAQLGQGGLSKESFDGLNKDWSIKNRWFHSDNFSSKPHASSVDQHQSLTLSLAFHTANAIRWIGMVTIDSG